MLTSSEAQSRIINLYGEPNARTDLNVVVNGHKAPAVTIAFILCSFIMLSIPHIYLARWNAIWVDRITYTQEWKKLTKDMIEEYTYGLVASGMMTIASISLLGLSTSFVVRTLAAVAVMSSICGGFYSASLFSKLRSFGGCAADAANLIQMNEHITTGLQGMALEHSVPWALIVWSALCVFISGFWELFGDMIVILNPAIRGNEPKACSYYLVDYTLDVVIWLRDIPTATLGLSETQSPNYLGLLLAEQSWSRRKYTLPPHRAFRLNAKNLLATLAVLLTFPSYYLILSLNRDECKLYSRALARTLRTGCKKETYWYSAQSLLLVVQNRIMEESNRGGQPRCQVYTNKRHMQGNQPLKGKLPARVEIRVNLSYSLSHYQYIDDIIKSLADHGCEDVTRELSVESFPEYPMSTGGYADIYKVDLPNGRRLAVKYIRFKIHTGIDEREYLERVAHELYVWSQCRHQNVAELIGVARFRDQLAMVSPWLENGDLNRFISRNPQVDRYALCIQVADGVAYIHGQGVVHGDLKGANILVSACGAIKICDFGNAKVAEHSLQLHIEAKECGMSLRWTAPEILEETTETTAEADIFALGMTILEVITGAVPYAGVAEVVVLVKILKGEHPTRPETYIPTGNKQADHLWSLLVSCWTTDTQHRPTALELRNRMKAIAPQKPRMLPPGPDLQDQPATPMLALARHALRLVHFLTVLCGLVIFLIPLV
ncbi:Cyclin-dependent kinase G1 [Arabidopsis thaliana] [Rhizoctonia solani]|uniref:Cyclin-dependent kinase G1 [Arabidopsis thaliana] n=1 Tax=Rhizoctonia solani TaxID=456999 RepID=A0A0K6G4J9_9AGAM|nr:Cyclin-dependent kinase G1 [Arabidopsis thaliana] [Rhizoctonia solani]